MPTSVNVIAAEPQAIQGVVWRGDAYLVADFTNSVWVAPPAVADPDADNPWPADNLLAPYHEANQVLHQFSVADWIDADEWFLVAMYDEPTNGPQVTDQPINVGFKVVMEGTAGGGTTTIAADNVARERTYRFAITNDTTVADNIVTLSSADRVTLAMEFKNVLNDGQDISSVVGVVEASGLIQASNVAKTADSQKALFDVGTGMIDAADYQMIVTVLSTDGQTYARQGQIQCRNS